MEVRSTIEADGERWDAFVQTHPQATPYHLFAWKGAVEAAYGHRGCYLLAEEGGAIVGTLPLVLMELPLLYRKLVSLPFCDVGGVLAKGADVAGRLYEEAFALAARLRASTLEMRNPSEDLPPAAASVPCATRADKVRMLLAIPSDSEKLWDGFKAKLRSQVRKAEKNGLTFRFGDREDRGRFYRVFSRNMRELGSPVHSRKWIEAVLDRFEGRARLGLVFLSDKPVGAGIILEAGDAVCVPWASTLREYNHLSPNMLLYWNFLKHAADSGRTRFDFGRSTYDEGTYRFKAQWGAEPSTLHWRTWRIGREQERRKAEPATASHNRELLAAFWSRLPLWAANSLGPVVRRHISL